MAPRASAARERERQRHRAKLTKALTEDDDPLAVYYQFIQWTLKHYGEKDPESGLTQLLEEATRVFKDDELYKTDLRYLKLWSLYARQVSSTDAIKLYASLISNNIGTSYSMLYEEYANLLDKDGRAQEADAIFSKGIAQNARPLERLKSRYRDFKKRSSLSRPSLSTTTITSSSTSKSQCAAPANLTATTSTRQSRYAVMLAPPPPGKRPERPRFNLSLLFTDEHVEYSIQEARARSIGLLGKTWAPLPTKNSSQPSISVTRDDFSTDVQKSTRFGPSKRKSLYGGGAEPTVTINTKEALADVFGMYNSPDKTRSIGLPGSKHAPLKKIDPITPIPQPRFTSPTENSNNENINRNRIENAPSQKTPATFRPFVDENAKVNRAAPASNKFTPFVDPSSSKKPGTANTRPVLSVKEASVPSSKSSLSHNPTEALSTTPSEAVFKVFTPAGREQNPPLAPLREAFTDDHGKPQPKRKSTMHERAHSQSAIGFSSVAKSPPTSSKAFRPLADGENARTPFKVFSRPPEHDQPQPLNQDLQPEAGDLRVLGKENPFTPKSSVAALAPTSEAKPAAFTPFRDESKPVTPAFRPYVDPGDKENAPAVSASATASAKPKPTSKEAQSRAVLAPSAGWPSSGVSSSSSSSFSDFAEIPEQGNVPVRYDEDYYEDDDDEEVYEIERAQLQHHVVEEDSEYEYEGESFQDAHHHHHYQDQESIPLGGRFGKINVMTPITERTIEYTVSTRAGTPSERLRTGGDDDYDMVDGDGETGEFDLREYQQRSELDAQRAAEELAAELQAEEDSTNLSLLEEHPGGISLVDTLTLSSKFKPPNPCNPFEPAILSILLSRIPRDTHYHDLRGQESARLDALQKFTKKTAGRKSGIEMDYFSLNLNGQRFSVSEKLGEGGFGSVFKARDLGVRLSNDEKDDDDEDDDDDDLDDEDDSGNSYVALKVVRPRNLWEYHILRRLHSALPPAAHRSIILPHALYAFKDESYLVLDFCPQGTLLTTVNNAVSAGVSQQSGSLDELLVMFFSVELLRMVETLHNVGFIHGDLKIDNCLLRLEDVPGGVSGWSSTYQPSGEGGWACKGLRIIDFGRAIDTRLFPSGQQFLAEWETDERDCFEVRENKPWTYQTDYFGLAGIIYCMLFGKYIQTSSIAAVSNNGPGPRYKIGTPFKRYWQTDLWSRLFDLLLNPALVRSDGSLPLCEELAGLRKEMEKWLQINCNRSSNTLKGLLKKVEMASLR
ncbi:hypothetical protein APHAL10511_007741 [Amanita phalloides]|nr:hypothetical protein APHAL10511_007741 [Amanita phalloides]